MTANYAAHHAFMGEPVDATLLRITDPEGVDKDQIARMTGRQKPGLDRCEDLVGLQHAAAIAGNGDQVSILDTCGGFIGRYIDHAGLQKRLLLYSLTGELRSFAILSIA